MAFNPHDIDALALLNAGQNSNFMAGQNSSFNIPTIQVENLTLPEVMKNPFVQRLYHSLQDATDKVMQGVQIQQNLYQENTRLTAEMKELRTLHQDNMLEIRQRPRSPSIAPSDSVSHLGTTSDTRSFPRSTLTIPHQPATRPSQYPVEVLWTLDDCKGDPDVRNTATNMSRPPMEQAIRHADGTMISRGEWSAIKATARLIKMDLLDLPTPRHVTNVTKKTKTYFRTHHQKDWNAAVAKMELQQPLLSLCAAHWKADHVLGNALLVSVAASAVDSDDNEAKSSRSPTKRKRSTGHKTDKAKKQKTGKDTGMGDNTMGSGQGNGTASRAGSIAPGNGEDEFNQGHVEPPPPTGDTDKGRMEPGDMKKQLGATTSLGSLANTTHPAAIDTSFIKVDDSLDNLQAILLGEFSIPHSADLLGYLQDPALPVGEPSEDMVTFLERIDNADPNSPDISEDDKGSSWGHHQFTGSSLKCRSVLSSWSCIGNAGIARRLIAAAIRTSRVARHLCRSKQPKPTSYLNDIYLSQVIEALWELCKSIVGAKPPPPPAHDTPAHALGATPGQNTGPQVSSQVKLPLGPPPANLLDNTCTREMLQVLTKDELKEFMKAHNLLTGGIEKRPKADMITAILEAPKDQQPSQQAIDETVQSRKARKAARSVQSKT